MRHEIFECIILRKYSRKRYFLNKTQKALAKMALVYLHLLLVYQNNLRFSEFLYGENSVAVHQKKFQDLVKETYKVKHGIVTEIMKDIFEQQNPSHNLRSCNQFKRENIKTDYYGYDSS